MEVAFCNIHVPVAWDENPTERAAVRCPLGFESTEINKSDTPVLYVR